MQIIFSTKCQEVTFNMREFPYNPCTNPLDKMIFRARNWNPDLLNYRDTNDMQARTFIYPRTFV